jgi:hypothetical protein
MVYPNPAIGPNPVHVYVPGLTGVSDVKVQVFTVAFRKVHEENFGGVLPNGSVLLALKDSRDKPLANGLYYVVVESEIGRSIGKLLIMR